MATPMTARTTRTVWKIVVTAVFQPVVLAAYISPMANGSSIAATRSDTVTLTISFVEAILEPLFDRFCHLYLVGSGI